MTRSRSKPKITIVGSGSLANALAPALRQAGYEIDEVISRDTPASRRRAAGLAKRVKARAAIFSSAQLSAPLIWLCVNDDSIANSAQTLADTTDWEGKIALHSSGALSSDEIEPLKAKGASIASAHPMMTFVVGKPPRMTGVPFALEGDPVAVRFAYRIAQDLGMEPFRIAKENKVLYHATGSFCSPLVVATLATAERVARAAKIPRKSIPHVMRPILLRTLENYLKQGPAAAFSGPIQRGDIATVRKHLLELKKVPCAREVYAALLRVALEDLPVKNRRQLLQMLGEAVAES